MSGMLAELDSTGTREVLRGRVLTRTEPDRAREALRDRLHVRLAEIARYEELGRVEKGPIDLVLARTPITIRSVDLTFTATARDWSSPASSRPATWPDLVVEIVTAPRDDGYLMAKIDDLLSAGVREAWVVDGDARAIEVHRRGAPVKISTATAGVREVRSSLLGGRPLSLDSLF